MLSLNLMLRLVLPPAMLPNVPVKRWAWWHLPILRHGGAGLSPSPTTKVHYWCPV